MEEIHPIFRSVPNDEDILWRYYTFQRFLDLLKTQALHFTRIDKFDDNFEGMWPIGDIRLLSSKGEFNVLNYTKFMRTHVVVSCWHQNKYESAAMWQLYNPLNDGIAIQTTYKKLKAEFSAQFNSDYELPFHGIAKVQYIDHLNQTLNTNGESLVNTFFPFVYKNVSYSFESEVRVLISRRIDEIEFDPGGYNLGLNIDDLIDKILINPLAPTALSEQMINELGQYGVSSKIEKSSLSKSKFDEFYNCP